MGNLRPAASASRPSVLHKVYGSATFCVVIVIDMLSAVDIENTKRWPMIGPIDMIFIDTPGWKNLLRRAYEADIDDIRVTTSSTSKVRRQ